MPSINFFGWHIDVFFMFNLKHIGTTIKVSVPMYTYTWVLIDLLRAYLLYHYIWESSNTIKMFEFVTTAIIVIIWGVSLWVGLPLCISLLYLITLDNNHPPQHQNHFFVALHAFILFFKNTVLCLHMKVYNYIFWCFVFDLLSYMYCWEHDISWSVLEH